MSGSPSRPAPVDLLALNDAQLREVLERSRRSDGSHELCVTNNWSLWSQEERDGLIQRLKAVQANSRPLDVDKLDALLRQVSNRDDDDASSPTRRRRSESRETEPVPDEREQYMQDEMEAYDSLVKDGGRPLYPIGMLESVSHDPGAHLEMLRPFWRIPHPDGVTDRDGFRDQEVFQRQQLRWRNFRKWQLDNRRIEEEGEHEEFLAHVENRKREYREWGWDNMADRIEANPEVLKMRGAYWYDRQRHRQWQRLWQREPDCDSFSDYEAALRARLTRHGFTRPFHLAEDPKQQDKLTEWIEYLGFEYWWLDRYDKYIALEKLEHDEKWEELAKSITLEDDETPDFVRTFVWGARAGKELGSLGRAREAAEAEEKEVLEQADKDPACAQMLVEAKERVLAANEAYSSTWQRNKLIAKFVRETTPLFI